MRYHIQGQHITIAPPLLAMIADRLEDLDTSSEDVWHADVILVKHQQWRRNRYEARVEVALAGRIVQAVQVAKTPYDALVAALKSVEQKLCARRSLEGVADGPPDSV